MPGVIAWAVLSFGGPLAGIAVLGLGHVGLPQSGRHVCVKERRGINK